MPNGTLDLAGNGVAFSTGKTVADNTWNTLELQFNFATRTTTAVFDGADVLAENFNSVVTGNLFNAGAFETIPSGTGTNNAFFDNYARGSGTFEPGSVGRGACGTGARSAATLQARLRNCSSARFVGRPR